MPFAVIKYFYCAATFSRFTIATNHQNYSSSEHSKQRRASVEMKYGNKYRPERGTNGSSESLIAALQQRTFASLMIQASMKFRSFECGNLFQWSNFIRNPRSTRASSDQSSDKFASFPFKCEEFHFICNLFLCKFAKSGSEINCNCTTTAKSDEECVQLTATWTSVSEPLGKSFSEAVARRTEVNKVHSRDNEEFIVTWFIVPNFDDLVLCPNDDTLQWLQFDTETVHESN